MKKTVIYLADDDGDDRSLFSEAIEEIEKNEIEKSVVCYAVKNGSGIFQLLNDNTPRPDIIFLDINMPVMDGWECLQKLKRDDKYTTIPVAMYSTTSHAAHVEKALRLGALCFLTKPDNFKQIKNILLEVIAGLPDNVRERIERFAEVKSAVPK
jgi:CheY-like chemotaxis protein